MCLDKAHMLAEGHLTDGTLRHNWQNQIAMKYFYAQWLAGARLQDHFFSGLQAEQDSLTLLLCKGKASPLGHMATASCLSYKAGEKNWGSRWVLEQTQKHSGSDSVTNLIALGCSRLRHPIPSTSFPFTRWHPISAQSISFVHCAAWRDSLAGKEEVPRAVLTSRARSSKGGILRAGASKLCVEETVGMMTGVEMKCHRTEPTLSNIGRCSMADSKTSKMRGLLRSLMTKSYKIFQK